MISKKTFFRVFINSFVFFFLLIIHSNVFAQQITVSYGFPDLNTKGYASVLIPDYFPVDINDDEVMAVGSLLDPNNVNSNHTALHLVRYNNKGQLLLNKIIDDPNANERAVSICVYDQSTFVILSSYSIQGAIPFQSKAKLTFVDFSGTVIYERLLNISNLNQYDNIYPLNAIMHNGDLYICGALQKGSTIDPVIGNVGLDFNLPKSGFVYNFNTQQISTIDPPNVSQTGQKFTLAKRLREVNGNLYVLGMYDQIVSLPSGVNNFAPFPFFAEVQTSSLINPLIPASNIKILSNGQMGCATDILDGQINGDYILLSQNLTNLNYLSNPTILSSTTGFNLSYIYSSLSLFKQKNLTLRDNQTVCKMFKIPLTNELVIAGWEQSSGGFNYNTWGGSSKRDNSFLYKLSYNFSPSSFSTCLSDFYIYNNFFNSTDSYEDLGGYNMSSFYLMPDNVIERNMFVNGYIINTLYKNKQANNYFHGLKTIFTNQLYSCDAIINPYISQMPFCINNVISNNTTNYPTNIISNIPISISISSIFSSFMYLNNSVEFCDYGGFYKKINPNNISIDVYPNPTNSNSVVKINLKDISLINAPFKIELYNQIGNIVDFREVVLYSPLLSYKIPEIKAGIYYLNVISKNYSKLGLPIIIK
jgi:hypothetical protein